MSDTQFVQPREPPPHPGSHDPSLGPRPPRGPRGPPSQPHDPSLGPRGPPHPHDPILGPSGPPPGPHDPSLGPRGPPPGPHDPSLGPRPPRGPRGPPPHLHDPSLGPRGPPHPHDPSLGPRPPRGPPPHPHDPSLGPRPPRGPPPHPHDPSLGPRGPPPHPHDPSLGPRPPHPFGGHGGPPFGRPGGPPKHDSPRPLNVKINFRPNDVLVATFPRSGTTWTIEIIRQLHLRHLGEDHYLTTERGKGGAFLDMMRHRDSESILEGMESPRILKTHAYYDECEFLSQDNRCKIIFVIRDPKDVICSLFEHSKVLHPGGRGDEIQEFAKDITGENESHRYIGGPADWCLFAEGYLNNPSNHHILYIKYEDLKASTSKMIGRINDFLGYPPLSQEEIGEVIDATSYDKMKGTHKEVAGNTTGKSGGYKERLSVENIAAMNKRVVELSDRIDDKHLNLRSYAENS
eukprot:sb/3464500/